MTDEIELGIADTRKLVDFLKKTYDYDFSNHALTSFRRRVARFITMNEINKIDDLIVKLQENKKFLSSFIKELTVEVTELFRDPAFWRFFRDKMQLSLNNFSSINIWIPNCSTGEEVLNTVIVAKESGFFDKIKVFATDSNEEILQSAKNCIFPVSKLELSADNYKRFNEKGNFAEYYTLEKGNFCLNKELLKNVTFDIVDLTKATSTKTFNVIIVRNKLIYFNSILHDNLITLFHKSLNLNGYLVLGHKETMSWCRDGKKFAIENDSEKVFKKIDL